MGWFVDIEKIMNGLPVRNVVSMRWIAQWLTRFPVTLAVGLAALMIAVFPAASEVLQFDRASISAGEVWRLVTCHLTHWNGDHLHWDLLMFVVIGGACELRNPRQMRWCVAMSAAVVAGLVLYCFQAIQEYRGLSGIDTALFTLLAINSVCDARREGNYILAMTASGLLGGFVAKTAFEAATGQTIFVDQESAGFALLVWDHIAAGVGGAMGAFVTGKGIDSTNECSTTQTSPHWRPFVRNDLFLPAPHSQPRCDQSRAVLAANFVYSRKSVVKGKKVLWEVSFSLLKFVSYTSNDGFFSLSGTPIRLIPPSSSPHPIGQPELRGLPSRFAVPVLSPFDTTGRLIEADCFSIWPTVAFARPV